MLVPSLLYDAACAPTLHFYNMMYVKLSFCCYGRTFERIPVDIGDYRGQRLVLEVRLDSNRDKRVEAERSRYALESINRDMGVWIEKFSGMTNGIPGMAGRVESLRESVNLSALDIAQGYEEQINALEAERRSIENAMDSLDEEFSRSSKQSKEMGGAEGERSARG